MIFLKLLSDNRQCRTMISWRKETNKMNCNVIPAGNLEELSGQKREDCQAEHDGFI